MCSTTLWRRREIGSQCLIANPHGPKSRRHRSGQDNALSTAPIPVRSTMSRSATWTKSATIITACGSVWTASQALALNGLGPDKIVSFDPGVEVVLERHDGYFGGPKGVPAIKKMVIRSIPDSGTQQAEMMRGGIHWMYHVKKDVGESLARTNRADYQLGASLRVGFLMRRVSPAKLTP
jgi:peptide/nickel transport system substrate-binding protein